MKLRARLAVTLALAAVGLLVSLWWGQLYWHSRLRVEAIAEAAVHRMESGGRERCEMNPAQWPGKRKKRHARKRGKKDGPFRREPRFFAYDASLQSANPDSPPFPPALAQQLREGDDVASDASERRRHTEVAVRMPWDDGPCAVMLVRTKGPRPWFSVATIAPAILVSLIVIIVALIAIGPMIRRVRRLTETVRKLGTGDAEPVRVEGADEIAELAEAFEQSRQTIEQQMQSLRDREAALRNYISNTTHDVMVPLSVLQGHLVALQQRIEAKEPIDADAMVPSLEEAQYLGSLLHNLNAAARLESVEGLQHRDDVDMNRLVERVVDRHQPIAKRKQIALNGSVPEAPVVFQGDITLLEQAIGNVIQNAVRYNQANGHVAVVLKGETDRWSLEVMDDGPGIDVSERDLVLQPSFRGTDARTRHPHGMGLGLHIAKDVAVRHGLSLELGTTEDGGLTVVFSLQIKWHRGQIAR